MNIRHLTLGIVLLLQAYTTSERKARARRLAAQLESDAGWERYRAFHTSEAVRRGGS